MKLLKLLIFVILIPIITFAESEIKLGMLAPLSGDFASYGNFIKDGVDSAVQKHKNLNIKVYYEDACFPGPSITAFKKLTSTQKVHAIVGSYCVIGLNSFAPLIDKEKVLVFHSSPIPKNILEKSKFIFSTNIRTSDEAITTANYAIKKLKTRTALITIFDSPWGQGFAKPFKKRFEELGGKVLNTEALPLDSTDFRSILTRYKSKNPDVIYIIDIAHRTGIVMKQARMLGLTSQYLTVDESEEANTLKVAGITAEGTILFAPEPKKMSPAQLAFHKDFQKRYGYPAKSLTTSAFDATNLVINSLIACKLGTICAKDTLYNVKDYKGLSGKISIEADGGTRKNLVRKVVENGKFVIAN